MSFNKIGMAAIQSWSQANGRPLITGKSMSSLMVTNRASGEELSCGDCRGVGRIDRRQIRGFQDAFRLEIAHFIELMSNVVERLLPHDHSDGFLAANSDPVHLDLSGGPPFVRKRIKRKSALRPVLTISGRGDAGCTLRPVLGRQGFRARYPLSEKRESYRRFRRPAVTLSRSRS